MELDPETREINVELRLPGNCDRHVEAAARIGALYSVVVLVRQFALVSGRGRRPQGLRESRQTSERDGGIYPP